MTAIVKEEQAEDSANTEEAVARALEAPVPSALSKEVVELTDDESKGLIASIAIAASTGPLDPDPSIPRVTTVLDMSGD